MRELVGGAYTPRDTAGAQGMHDFDLRLGDGRTFAVEVTTDTSSVDKAFQDQISRINPLDVPGLNRVWHVDLWTPGDGPDDQRASSRRVKSLIAELPDILQQLEQAGRTKLYVPRQPSRTKVVDEDRLRDLGVQQCFSFDHATDENPQVFFGEASRSGATGPSLIVEAVNESMRKKDGSLSNKVTKLVNAQTAGADEAHLFLWLTSGQEFRRGRAEAMSFLRYTGLDGLEPIDLHGIDAVWVAVDAGPSHARDCRHHWPILYFDTNGWHDWRLRRSP